MTRHNKKRNIGLLYEFLVRTISESIIEGNEQKRKLAYDIVKTHFSKNTELFREFRLFHSLVATTVKSESVADSILEAAKMASRKCEHSTLDRQKSLLIRDINHNLNENGTFYNKKIPEYKIYATVQTLLNEWRSGQVDDIVRVAQFEEQLKQWLLKDKNVVSLNEEAVRSADPLVEKLMLKKLNERYQGALTKNQSDLIRAYIFSSEESNREELYDYVSQIKESALSTIDSYLESEKGKNTYLEDKLGRAKQMILAESIDNIDDNKVEKFLDIAKLHHEIAHKE